MINLSIQVFKKDIKRLLKKYNIYTTYCSKQFINSNHIKKQSIDIYYFHYDENASAQEASKKYYTSCSF